MENGDGGKCRGRTSNFVYRKLHVGVWCPEYAGFIVVVVLSLGKERMSEIRFSNFFT